MVPPAVAYLTSRPWLARALVTWNVDHHVLMHLDLDLADLIGMAVSQESSCRYCYAATRWLLRIRGMSERRVRLLEQQIAGDALDARMLAAVRYARALSRAAPLPRPDDRERLLAAGFTPEEHRDLAFGVAYAALANRVHTIIAVPPERLERLSGWRASLMRPVMRPLVRRFQGPGRAVSAAESPGVGPYSGLLETYAGTPIELLLKQTLEEMHASTVLPPRVKALIFAVVARALDCEISAREARAMLPPDVAADALEQTLAHLGGPDADELDVLVADFARDTIWYRPLEVQRRARALRDALSTEQFVETVGVASLANALCRLAAAVAEAD